MHVNCIFSIKNDRLYFQFCIKLSVRIKCFRQINLLSFSKSITNVVCILIIANNKNLSRSVARKRDRPRHNYAPVKVLPNGYFSWNSLVHLFGWSLGQLLTWTHLRLIHLLWLWTTYEPSELWVRYDIDNLNFGPLVSDFLIQC